MVAYLAASVIGVVLIVFLVVHLTKGSTKSPAGRHHADPRDHRHRRRWRDHQGFVFTQAAKVGTYPLNQAATTEFASAALKQAAPMMTEIKSAKAGQPGQSMVSIYDLGTVSSIHAAGYKGIVFIGYNGTFNPAAVIKLEQAKLVSSRSVTPGPHGGEMVCGYSTVSGSEASECVWVTSTTLGEVQFAKGATPVKYPGAAALALMVRNDVEVHGS